jgi:hypothetical protein
VELARTDRADTQTDAPMDLAEVLRLAGRDADAAPVVDALRRYEAKRSSCSGAYVRSRSCHQAPP